ncbi:hypothetical protein AAFF_G00062680 [Aldrovandia affinis]|uniref:Uncharacterized protein n=1 Tax=Aldrovandia affinis TaxID=143900 RepID=A0AAD7RZE7_9TELE|nr:hypothetical protein AAFF_G00062680 [Aldrovandia affinis]
MSANGTKTAVDRSKVPLLKMNQFQSAAVLVVLFILHTALSEDYIYLSDISGDNSNKSARKEGLVGTHDRA